MKNKFSSFFIATGILSLFTLIIFSCKKDKIVTADKQVAFFANTSPATFGVKASSTTYKVYVGLTKASQTDRTVAVSITSPTGAVQGTQYTLSGNSLTFTAGSVLDSITVTADLSKYLTGRIDTLIFKFTNAEDGLPSLNDSLILKIVRACTESDIVFADLLGDYTKTYENNSYGPYTTTISNLVAVNATSSKADFENLYDSGITAQMTFDYSTPGAFTVTVPAQATGFAVGGLPLSIKSVPGPGGANSSFTYCTPTFTIYLQLYTSGGIVDTWTMTTAR